MILDFIDEAAIEICRIELLNWFSDNFHETVVLEGKVILALNLSQLASHVSM